MKGELSLDALVFKGELSLDALVFRLLLRVWSVITSWGSVTGHHSSRHWRKDLHAVQNVRFVCFSLSFINFVKQGVHAIF